MKILIVGVGGVGGFLGSQLLKAGHDVFFVARGKRFEFLSKHGLEVKSKLGNVKLDEINVLKTIPKKEKFDVIISTVKLYDFDDFISEIKNIQLSDTIILPFQNGIYSEQRIMEQFGKENTYGAVAQISSFINEKQIIIHKGILATFFVGKVKSQNSEKLSNFSNECKIAGLDLRIKTNIEEKIWEKFIFLSAYSGITTFSKKTIGEIFTTPTLKGMFINAMKETFNLSKYFNVKFKSDPIQYWISKIEKMPFDMTSSMFLDFIQNKKIELKWLSGSVVEYSKIFGNYCGTHKMIIDELNIK